MKVVTIGGGTGQHAVLSALRLIQERFGLAITAIPTAMDSGGSSGMLRIEHRIISPGDIGQCILALSEDQARDAWLLAGQRFGEGRVNGDTLRNYLVLAALKHHCGDGERAMRAIRETLHLAGEIAPVTFDETHVHARLADGTVLTQEHDISTADLVGAGGIEELWLDPLPRANPSALRAIAEADAVIVCPGTLACSVIPNFLVPSIVARLREAGGRKAYVVNLMNERRRVPATWSVRDYVAYLEQYLGPRFFDTVVCNTQPVTAEQSRVYEEERAAVPLLHDMRDDGRSVYAVPLLSAVPVVTDPNDAIGSLRASVRHDPAKLAHVLSQVLAGDPA
ncbi:MAG: uridine diphosphate-N-acetylglucosamine-binding protein YvcK [Patescibacteria group bacterium]|nr:uridine diphosphate-N-acetylglucosamine-binding protein YvcK [Patescibacteria group bacterium]MDE1944090.1 uridine diphosphate-N-acetylglucosamine-binding protein YvcK [Patescibacteria group bacterium]MDE1944707.1 uridine diphosphate-N-acetylglucosamine-binding protein YvcK [Patescibacteria group bacterium]MDE2057598.1 uridine diphosphate-N-acetylglucosamine-binding protein YvcK [Patescibacteria group bacterium]